MAEDEAVSTDPPHSDTIVLECDQLPTEGAVLAHPGRSNLRLGDIVTIRVEGNDVTNAVVIEGDGDDRGRPAPHRRAG